MTSNLIDEVIREVRDYEKTSLGTKYGQDFPSFASELITSKQFKELTMQLNVVSLLAAMSFKPGADEDPKAQLEGGPLKEMLAMALYVGYRLGKHEREVGLLETNYGVTATAG